jgi:hypothetical protein
MYTVRNLITLFWDDCLLIEFDKCGSIHFLVGKQNGTKGLTLFCPQAGLALPFPNDEKEAKILSKRTLRRAF